MIDSQQPGLVALLETRIKPCNMGSLYLRMFQEWCFSSNSPWNNGGRIVLAWNPDIFHVDILLCSSQIMHLKLVLVSSLKQFYATVVYGFNKEADRIQLWQDLQSLNMKEPWIVFGDFNAILEAEDRIGERAQSVPSVELLKVVQVCRLEDVRYTGNRYTWTNRQLGTRRIWSKIDRVLANEEWLDIFEDAEVNFQFEAGLDHTMTIVSLSREQQVRRGLFRYFKMWRLHPDFYRIVEHEWRKEESDSLMFQIVQKLNRLKRSLNQLNRKEFSHI